MRGYHDSIEQQTLTNTDYRRVLYTGKHSRPVLTSLKPNEEIGLETHTDNDQFFRLEQGEGRVLIDGNEYPVSDGSAVVVPAGVEPIVIKTSQDAVLKLNTIYAPAHHQDGVTRASKAEADADATEFYGKTSE